MLKTVLETIPNLMEPILTCTLTESSAYIEVFEAFEVVFFDISDVIVLEINHPCVLWNLLWNGDQTCRERHTQTNKQTCAHLKKVYSRLIVFRQIHRTAISHILCNCGVRRHCLAPRHNRGQRSLNLSIVWLCCVNTNVVWCCVMP